MKVKKSEAVEFLRSLDFEKASEWDNAKLTSRLGQLPEKIKEDEVPESGKAFYKRLVEANGALELEDDMPEGEKKGKSKSEKPAKKEKKEKAEKPAKKKKEKKQKVERETDAYGATVGSIRAKVNATFDKNWKSLDDILEEAGVKVRQAKSRLRRAVREKVLEVRRRVEYRLVEKKK